MTSFTAHAIFFLSFSRALGGDDKQLCARDWAGNPVHGRGRKPPSAWLLTAVLRALRRRIVDRGILVTLGRTGRIPSLLVKNWKISHGCDPVAAARKSLAFEKSSRWKALSAIIGAVIFLATVFFLGIVMPSTGSGGKISAEWLLPFLGGMFIWLLAHVVAMEIEGHFGLRAIENEFREEACVFGGYLEELSVAAGTPSWSALANMDLKALAEKLLVDRAEQVLQAE